ncbi:hypothetical protein LCGC14_1753860, partial [marine sediment metagenome]
TGSHTNTEIVDGRLKLSSGQTSGTYTSEIFDANDPNQWNTLTWQGAVPNLTANSVVNESGWVNSTGYPLSGFDSSWSGITLTALYDSTNNSQIELGDATVNSLGVVTNAASNEWGNVLISYDYNTPFNASLSFQVRSCLTSDCSNASFASADLTDMSILGQWFQYQASFSSSNSSISPLLENVVINSSLGIVSVTISEPNGTKSSQTGIPINFAVTGLNLNCWYNLDNGENVTLADCSDSSFNAPDDGNYVFNLYANNSLGAFDHQSSTFSVDTPAPSSSSEEESSITGEVTSEFVETVKLTAGEIQSLTMNPGETKQLSWNVKNVWTFPLQECNFESIGSFYSWISYTENKTLDAGEEHTFNFDISVPAETEVGEYNLGVTLKCPGTGKSALFIVEVVEKTLEFELINVQRVSDSQVEVVYSLKELSGSEQNVELKFSLFDADNIIVSEATETKTLSANLVEEFETLISIDESLVGELILSIDLNSEVYSSFVQEGITIGAPVGGFAIFGEDGFIGTGGGIILIIVVFALVTVLFVARTMRKSGKTLKDVFNNLEGFFDNFKLRFKKPQW